MKYTSLILYVHKCFLKIINLFITYLLITRKGTISEAGHTAGTEQIKIRTKTVGVFTKKFFFKALRC